MGAAVLPNLRRLGSARLSGCRRVGSLRSPCGLAGLALCAPEARPLCGGYRRRCAERVGTLVPAMRI